MAWSRSRGSEARERKKNESNLQTDRELKNANPGCVSDGFPILEPPEAFSFCEPLARILISEPFHLLKPAPFLPQQTGTNRGSIWSQPTFSWVDRETCAKHPGEVRIGLCPVYRGVWKCRCPQGS